jgi:hypothetical protein
MNVTGVLGLDLFQWWAACISGGSVFLTLVSIYLYKSSKTKREAGGPRGAGAIRFAVDFVFVWVLLGLLVFYIVSIDIGSAAIFAAGNILVEALLIVYLLKNKKGKSDEP